MVHLGASRIGGFRPVFRGISARLAITLPPRRRRPRGAKNFLSPPGS